MGSNFTKLTERDFGRLSKLIDSVCGIKMPPQKKTMVQARLQKRLKSLAIPSHSEYCDYLFSQRGMEDELVNMIDVVTTNKTDFFREPRHFEYLESTVLPEMVRTKKGGFRDTPFKLWSAGCSTGEEPYTIAMVLAEFAEKHSGFNYSILATDISTKVLYKAMEGVYRSDRVDPVPMKLKKKFLLKSKDESKQLVRVVPELIKTVNFKRVNFMDDDFGLRERMDVVFMRNVLIYFERPKQERIINRVCAHMKRGAYLFIGHSETLYNVDAPIEPVRPTVYKRV